MELDELLRRAWEAVQKAGIPEPIQEAAFKEAVAYLRDEEGGTSPAPSTGDVGTGSRGRQRSAAKKPSSKTDGLEKRTPPDEKTFFANLANESDVPETDLRDVLQLTKEGEVRITAVTRRLGSTVAEQAKTTIALVAGARGVGLGESPVDAKAVRKELERKRCYQVNNYSNRHLASLNGFNAGGRDEIVLTSKWVDEFESAVKRALGKTADEDKSG